MRNTLLQLDKLLQVQQRCLDALEYDQARKILNALRCSRVKQLLVLVFSNIITAQFTLGHLSNLPLVIMAGFMILFNTIGMAGAMWQLQVLQQQAYWENLHGAQKRIGLLQTAVLLQHLMIRFSRIRLLALPFGGLFIAFMVYHAAPALLTGIACLLLLLSLSSPASRQKILKLREVIQ